MSDVLETPTAFAKRTGLPVRHVRQYVRQGKLPHIKTGKSHVLIHVPSGLNALQALCNMTAGEIKAAMPIPLPIIPSGPRIKKPTGDRKYHGRVPDRIKHGLVSRS